MVKQILKYNLTKKHYTWDRSYLGLIFKFLETQLIGVNLEQTNVRINICTVHESNWSICVKKCYAITIKDFFSERCTSTASKTETVTRDCKIFESSMLRKFVQLFKNVLCMTVTVKGKWNFFWILGDSIYFYA